MPSGEKTPKQIPPAMEANKWKPGQSGNPSGRPRRLPISDRYAAMAELPLPDYVLAALKLSEAERPAIKTYGDALALSQFRAGIKGKTEAAREITDRVEGRARQQVELSASLDVVSIRETIEKRRAERLPGDKG